MNRSKWSRLSLVVHVETAKDLALIASATDSSISKIVRELITEPSAVMAEQLGAFNRVRSPEDLQRLDEQVDRYVTKKYGDYLNFREISRD